MAHTCRAQRFIRLHRSGMADCQSGDLDEAVVKLSMALLEVQNIGLECYQVKILNNLGIVFELKGNKKKARDHYQTAFSMARHKLGENAKLSQVVCKNLARVS
jgi:hypothetical protein